MWRWIGSINCYACFEWYGLFSNPLHCWLRSNIFTGSLQQRRTSQPATTGQLGKNEACVNVCDYVRGIGESYLWRHAKAELECYRPGGRLSKEFMAFASCTLRGRIDMHSGLLIGYCSIASIDKKAPREVKDFIAEGVYSFPCRHFRNCKAWLFFKWKDFMPKDIRLHGWRCCETGSSTYYVCASCQKPKWQLTGVWNFCRDMQVFLLLSLPMLVASIAAWGCTLIGVVTFRWTCVKK